MKYMLLSDIHGCLPALEKALDWYRRWQCDMLCILGDIHNYGPRNRIPEGIDAQGIAERLNAMADEVVAVRGNCDSEVDQMLLHFPMMHDYMLLADEGRRLFLTHGHVYNEDRLPPGRYDCVFTGHTHRWHLERRDGTVYCNTGSITFPKDGNPPTLATYEHGTVTVYTLDGEELKKIKK